MGKRAKDGASVSATEVVRIDCSECGVVETTVWPQTDNEVRALINIHIRKHDDRLRRSLDPWELR